MILIGNVENGKQILAREDEFVRFLTLLAMAPATPPYPFMPQAIALNIEQYGCFKIEPKSDWDYVKQYINEGDVPQLKARINPYHCYGWFDRSEDEVIIIASSSIRTHFTSFMIDLEDIKALRLFDAPAPFK